MTRWPFADPQNVAVITTMRIARGLDPIDFVSHDVEDGTWQFHSSAVPFSMKDAAIIALKNIVARDPSIAELADLPLGWQATRSSLGAPWQRSKSPDEGESL